MKLLAATALSVSLLASAFAQTKSDGLTGDQNHSKRLTAVAAGTAGELHWCRTRRPFIPGERSGAHVRRPRYV